MQRIKRLAEDGECCRPCEGCTCPPGATQQFFVESGFGGVVTGGSLTYTPPDDEEDTGHWTYSDGALEVSVRCRNGTYNWDVSYDNGFGTNWHWDGTDSNITYCENIFDFIVQFENGGDNGGIFLSVFNP